MCHLKFGGAMVKASFPAAEEHIGRRSRHPEGNPSTSEKVHYWKWTSMSGPFYCPLRHIFEYPLTQSWKAKGHIDPPHDLFCSSCLPKKCLRLRRGDGRNKGRIWRVSFRILPSPRRKTNFGGAGAWCGKVKIISPYCYLQFELS